MVKTKLITTIFVLLTSLLIGQTKIGASIHRYKDDTTKFKFERIVKNDSIIFEMCRLELIERVKKCLSVMDFDQMVMDMTNPVKISVHSKVTIDDTLFHKTTYTEDSRITITTIRSLFLDYEDIWYIIYKSNDAKYKKSFLIKFYTGRSNFINMLFLFNNEFKIDEVEIY